MSNSTVSQLDLAVAQPDLQPQAGSSVPEAQTPPPRPPPRRLILQGARATRAYGIQLSPECLDRFCRKYHEMVRPGQLEKMTAKQVRVALRDILSPSCHPQRYISRSTDASSPVAQHHIAGSYRRDVHVCPEGQQLRSRLQYDNQPRRCPAREGGLADGGYANEVV
ncbi:hypothetical protein L226DRAFT_68051 [Lentinus tigrinus ALCF2SS1-7]|uniref:Uncharacterized protein n=1 Tax=Lentinus tigrinus ALCF2SS1-6 TaxID=1328759 RepID=A0A5C2SA94_9APHY|nr:hypothetical protein L227DRAFT_109032 [Lentinus tigrinus ALCF2SS1-6]RPD74894.1 hypothetical protein L226DRAFT_68051 [Lentinus tigrinus ALCF2SS1-7]